LQSSVVAGGNLPKLILTKIGGKKVSLAAALAKFWRPIAKPE
jgi:hypothetical protein